MAMVTGYTAARMKAIEDQAIINGGVVLDNLILTRFNGVQINAGNVRGPQGTTGATGPSGTAVVTSTTYPTTPVVGQLIYESDTNRHYSWNGTAWVYKGGVFLCTSSTRPINPFVGLSIYETDTNRGPYTWNGTTWLYRSGDVVCTSTTRPAAPFTGQRIFESDTGKHASFNGTAWVWDVDIRLVTSTSRPASPYTGLMIYELDTLKFYIWDGTYWTPPKNVPGGTLGYAQITSGSGSLGTTSGQLMALNGINIPAGRRIRVTGRVFPTLGTGAAVAYCDLYQEGQILDRAHGTSIYGHRELLQCVLFPSAGTHNYSINVFSNAGVVSNSANDLYPTYIHVEDIGGV